MYIDVSATSIYKGIAIEVAIVPGAYFIKPMPNTVAIYINKLGGFIIL